MDANVGRRPRRRRTPDEARREALVSARALLIERGPNAVTLKAVADEIGVTHVNLIHHFGSAAGLQAALMGAMVRDLTDALAAAVIHLRSEAGAPRALVDQVCEAMDKGGAGRLAAWIALSGDLEHLEPVRVAIKDLVEAIHEKFASEGPGAREQIRRAVLFIALCSFGDAVIGNPLRDMLEQDDESTREILARVIPMFFLSATPSQ
jgi:AcrR family transcriptional regulator